ncbi:MAG: tetratricopeptide repeat protein [Paracoccaceae bacterium]
MRHPILVYLCIAGSMSLSACMNNQSDRAEKALKDITAVDQANMNDLMLSAGDPEESVAYFSNALAKDPTNAALKRGLAKSLTRSQKSLESAKVWRELAYSPEGTSEDRVGLADALIRNNDWKAAQTELNQVPPTYETYERYRLEAMVADSNKQWKKADSFYETAFGMTTKPSSILNNWGYSKLTRGDFAGAEKLFMQALKYDSTVFTSKNNLVLARSAQRKYDMPMIQMTQQERAQLLYTAALTAVKHGDVDTGKNLLQEAIDTSPQYFEEAVRALETLDGTVTKP